MPTSFVLNGASTTLDADPTMPLLWAIREVAGLHGTKFGCGMALCGACTVHVNGEAVRSCVMPLSTVAGKQVITIEACRASRPRRYKRRGSCFKYPSAAIAKAVKSCRRRLFSRRTRRRRMPTSTVR